MKQLEQKIPNIKQILKEINNELQKPEEEKFVFLVSTDLFNSLFNTEKKSRKPIEFKLSDKESAEIAKKY
jgi:hypothetical protein